MEFVEGDKKGLYFSEEELWRMSVCLAKAAVAMGRLDGEWDGSGRQFLHMDMHAGNGESIRISFYV